MIMQPSAYLGANEVPNDGLITMVGQLMRVFHSNNRYWSLLCRWTPFGIDVDNYGFAHIIYEDSGDIEYITNSSGFWSSSTTAPTDIQTDAGYHLRAKVDGLDRLQVAYTSEFNGTTDIQFMYLDTVTGSWSIEWLVDTITTSSLTSEFQLILM